MENDGAINWFVDEVIRFSSGICDPRTELADQAGIDAGRVDESAPTYALSRRRTTAISTLQT